VILFLSTSFPFAGGLLSSDGKQQGSSGFGSHFSSVVVRFTGDFLVVSIQE
jgi:hypothetical protein